MFFGGNNFYAQQTAWRAKVVAFKICLAALAGVLLWAWVTFDLRIPVGDPQPTPSPTTTVQQESR